MLAPGSPHAELKLARKTIEGDYCYLKFSFADPEKVLGHRIGQSVQLSRALETGAWRHYIPISRLDEQGTADFLIKLIDQRADIMAQCEFSRILRTASVGDTFWVKGPVKNWLYEGFGKISITPPMLTNSSSETGLSTSLSSEPVFKGQFDNLVMIAHDNAVTAFFTLIDTVSSFPKDKTSLTLIYFVDRLVAIADLGRPSTRIGTTSASVHVPLEPKNRSQRET